MAPAKTNDDKPLSSDEGGREKIVFPAPRDWNASQVRPAVLPAPSPPDGSLPAPSPPDGSPPDGSPPDGSPPNQPKDAAIEIDEPLETMDPSSENQPTPSMREPPKSSNVNETRTLPTSKLPVPMHTEATFEPASMPLDRNDQDVNLDLSQPSTTSDESTTLRQSSEGPASIPISAATVPMTTATPPQPKEAETTGPDVNQIPNANSTSVDQRTTSDAPPESTASTTAPVASSPVPQATTISPSIAKRVEAHLQYGNSLARRGSVYRARRNSLKA